MSMRLVQSSGSLEAWRDCGREGTDDLANDDGWGDCLRMLVGAAGGGWGVASGRRGLMGRNEDLEDVECCKSKYWTRTKGLTSAGLLTLEPGVVAGVSVWRSLVYD